MTTRIGLFPLAMSLAKQPTVALFTITLLSLMACTHENPHVIDSDDFADNFCKGQCNSHFKKFTGQAVHLEIEPSSEMSQVFYNVDPTNLSKKPLVLSQNVRILGHAFGIAQTLLDEDREKSPDHQADFFDIIALPSANRNLLAPCLSQSKSHLGPHGYQLSVLTGVFYTLILNPAGMYNRAPVHLNNVVIAADATINFFINNALSSLKGRVIFTDADGYKKNPVTNMKVFLKQGSRLASSVASVDDEGKFSIEISNPLFSETREQPFHLIVEPENFDIALPRIKQKIDASLFGKDMGDIDLGKLKKPISVDIEVHGSDDSLVGNAFLYLSAKVGSGEIVVKKQTDASGIAKFEHLYEGSYDIAIIPPVDSEFAMRVTKAVEFDSENNMQLSIDLKKRSALDASVFTYTGERVKGAHIELLRIGETGLFATEDIYDDNIFKLTAATNDEGHVCQRKFGFSTSDKNECKTLLLDEGRYLAHIIPPAGSELSHQWVTFDFPEKHQLIITLDQPEVLFGRIIKPDMEPLKRAFITVYLAEISMHNQPKMIGHALTDEQGYWRAFVPAANKP